MSKEIGKSSTGALAFVCGIASVLLTFAYSVGCAILDLSHTLPRSVTVALVFVGLIFGIIGIFVSNMSIAASGASKNKFAVAGLIFSIVSIILCVYSFILYVDLIYFTEKVLTSVAPALLAG